MGYTACTKEQIYCSSYVAACYIKEKYPHIKKVRVVGMNSIREELRQQGIDSEGGEDDHLFPVGDSDENKSQVMTMKDFENFELDPTIQAVLVGLDTKFTYAKLAIASLYIHTGRAKFIATNEDAYDVVQGRRMPGAGAMIKSILFTLGEEGENNERQKPEVVAKPNPYVVDLIMKNNNISKKEK